MKSWGDLYNISQTLGSLYVIRSNFRGRSQYLVKGITGIPHYSTVK